ncbi:hypothetical protein LCGC14_2593570, partial [marine sediment metagenome]
GGFLQHPARWTLPEVAEASWGAWLVGLAKGLGYIFVIILALLFLMKLLKWLKVTDLLGRMLEPVLRMLGMSARAAPITIIGMTLGISFGGGLIIQEARSGRLDKRDVFFSLVLMGLAHSLIEDTLLMVAVGAHYSGILVGRLVFALAVTFVLVRVLAKVPDRVFDRMLFRMPKPTADVPA